MKNYLLEDHHRFSKMPQDLRQNFTYLKKNAFASLLAGVKQESLLVAQNHESLKRVFNSLQESFFKKQADLRNRVKILILDGVPSAARSALEGLFKEVVVIPGNAALPLNELLEIVSYKNRKNYVIGGQVDEMTRTVTLIRGDLSKLVVPFSAFRPSGRGTEPDFKRFSVEDFGQTFKFGAYESSVDAVLYEFDSRYRKERKAELARRDRRFGACLRRLRILKGFKQTDFPGVDAREIGRIERGEVVKPRKLTINRISKRLGVDPSEIETY